MATRALQQVVTYLAWNTSTNAYVTGDSANHTTSWCKDGTRAATTNATAEVDGTNLPGLYKVTMTSTETDCIEGVLGGKSSTSNVVLIPTMVAFDYLNTSAPATAGVPDVNMKNIANAAVSTSSAQLGVNAVNIGGTAQTGRDIGASVLLSSGTGTGQVSLSSGTVTVGTNNDKTGYSLTQTFPTNFSSLGISAGGHISNVDTLTTYTGNTVQTGDAYARLGAPAGASVSADVAAIKTDLDAGVTVATIATAAASLKKNTAFSHFEFLMTDSTNHNPMTGLTVTATHSIDGAAFASCTNAVAEVASGIYQINLSAADLNGNCITYRFTGTGADDRDVTVFTQP